ncbi:MAG: M16 family metallopeptidase [Christensenellales bacterium]
MSDKQIYTFPNGSTLVYYKHNYNKCTDVNVGFRIPLIDIPNPNEVVGTYKNVVFYMDENNNLRIPRIKPGIAHMVEHMFFTSLPDLPKSEIFNKLQRTNTIYNAETSQDYVKTEFNCPSKFVDEIFELESRLLFRDGYNKEDLDNEKKPIFQELEMVIDNKSTDVIDMLTNNMETLTEEEILGLDKLVIDSITEKQLIRFAKTYFTKENLVMTVSSDLPFEKIKELCEKNFVEKAPSIIETKITTPPRQYEFYNDIMYLTPSAESKTSTIEFILKGSTDYEKNDIFTNIEDFLLNSFNGRLFNKFRNNNGLVYTPAFYTLDMPQQPFKIFSIQTTPKNVRTCMANLTEVLDDLLTNGITDEEFSGFKEMWENRRERKSAIKYNSAETLFNKMIYNQPLFVSDFYEKTRSLTKEEINKYIWEIYSKSKLCVFVSGNYNKKDLMPLQTILAKYRPYDKYINKNLIDHDEAKQLNEYLVYYAQHPNEKTQIHFVGEEEAKLLEKKQAKEKQDKSKSNKQKSVTNKKKKTNKNLQTKKQKDMQKIKQSKKDKKLQEQTL